MVHRQQQSHGDPFRPPCTPPGGNACAACAAFFKYVVDTTDLYAHHPQDWLLSQNTV